MLTSSTVVIRDGKQKEINTEELVPGDIVLLSEGNKIPADMNLIECFSLKVDESVLTGESVPSNKRLKPKEITKLFSGTTVVSGKAKAEVTKTGIRTEFGKIVGLVAKESKSTSLFEHQLNKLSKNIVIILVILIIILFIIGLFRGLGIVDMFLISVSLAISAIPEGLPIVITLTLAMGVQIMSKKNSIVRKMSSIEALGSTTVICSDKTGTLTLNEMTVKKVATSSFSKEIKGTGYSINDIYKENNHELNKLLDVCENCNDSFISSDSVIGDPTEIALKVLSRKFNYTNNYKTINEMPFTSERKMMSTAHKINNNYELLTKGAFSEVIKKSNRILINGKVRKITQKDINKFKKLEEGYAEGALRVLGFAYKPINNIKNINEDNLIFLGLVGMIDPPRADVKKALELSRRAGIKTKIITGDYALTAKAIAKDIGFKNVRVTDASEIDNLDNKQATELIKKTDIFARAKPNHKFRIVELLKAAGEVVAVTGDGVNDAPAIKSADIGIAMGIKGTEATKEVADIVLKDDNFSSIIEAIKQGRRIYDNIILFVKYMLAVNFDLLLTVGLLTIFNLPIPLLALQILWINMVTDSLPAIALGRRKASKDIMERPPRRKGEGIFNRFVVFIVVALIVKIVGELILFSYGMGLDISLGINTFDLATSSYARTIILTAIVVFELFFAFIVNAEGKFTKEHLLSNKPLIYSCLLVLVLQIFVVYNGFMQNIFHLVPLTVTHWIYIFIFGLSSMLVIPITNFVKKVLKK